MTAPVIPALLVVIDMDIPKICITCKHLFHIEVFDEDIGGPDNYYRCLINPDTYGDIGYWFEKAIYLKCSHKEKKIT